MQPLHFPCTQRLISDHPLYGGACSEGGDLNLFRTHSYGPEPLIGSISLGVRRQFLLKPKKSSDKRAFHAHLGEGDMLVMLGSMNQLWKHGITKKPNDKSLGPRISLTFHRIVQL
jgi:hypothetical protein